MGVRQQNIKQLNFWLIIKGVNQFKANSVT